MDGELLVAEQIVRLLRGPQGKVWQLVDAGLDGPDDGEATPGRVLQRLRPHAGDVAIRDAQGFLVALARPDAA